MATAFANGYSTSMSENILQIKVSPLKMVTQNEKKYKKDRMKEILSAICALLNSGDGKLELCFDQTPQGRHIQDIARMIEQRVAEMVPIKTMVTDIKIEAHSQQIVVSVKQTSHLVSVSLNFSLPFQTQVISVPPNEPIENIKNILQVGRVGLKSAVIGSRRKVFTKGQNLSLLESNNVQYKNLKAQSSKCIKLADRITGKSNRLTSYVCAFANCVGGHIYYGITDDGIVDGEEIKEKEKKEIAKKVGKIINKMIWPQHCSQPCKGKQWDIFFEPVKDVSGSPVPSTFVIVIYVAPCPGGVFIEEPESYYIAKGKVKKMSFASWLAKLTESLAPLRFASISSPDSRDTCRKIRTL